MRSPFASTHTNSRNIHRQSIVAIPQPPVSLWIDIVTGPMDGPVRKYEVAARSMGAAKLAVARRYAVARRRKISGRIASRIQTVPQKHVLVISPIVAIGDAAFLAN